MRTILTVVLNNKSYKDSLSLKCLMSHEYSNADVLIINNGPSAIEFDKNFLHTLGFFVKSISTREFLDNRPLSWIYNGVINEYRDFDRFIFLDDDDVLTKNFLTKLDSYHTEDVDLQIPNVKERTNGRVYYPRINKKLNKNNDGEIINPHSGVLSISSGLVIYHSLIEKFSDLNLEVFDSRFALYGVDYNFFNRLEWIKKKNVNIVIQIVGTIEVALSLPNDGNREIQEAERLYDKVLSGKYYSRNKLLLMMRMIKLAVNQIIKFKFSNVDLIIKTFIKGKHPRC